ncbi:putative reverse transcriptase domain-containing protein [Tanacetum coccineum]
MIRENINNNVGELVVYRHQSPPPSPTTPATSAETWLGLRVTTMGRTMMGGVCGNITVVGSGGGKMGGSDDEGEGEDMTITCSGMTPEAIEELIAQRVAEALANYEATHAANALEAENGGNNKNRNPNENGRGVMPVACVCTYQDFVKCQPLNFKGTEGVVGLTRWFEKIETVFHISNCPEVYQVKSYEVDDGSVLSKERDIKIETELWNLTVRNNDLAAYTQRFQELTMLCTRIVLEEEDRIESLMDQKLKGYAIRSAENKRKFESNQRDNRAQQPPFKRQNVGGSNVARAYTAGGNERRVYVGPHPLGNKYMLHHVRPCTVKCRSCGKFGHLNMDCKPAVLAAINQRAPVVNQRIATCFECGRQGHFKKD